MDLNESAFYTSMLYVRRTCLSIYSFRHERQWRFKYGLWNCITRSKRNTSEHPTLHRFTSTSIQHSIELKPPPTRNCNRCRSISNWKMNGGEKWCGRNLFSFERTIYFPASCALSPAGRLNAIFCFNSFNCIWILLWEIRHAATLGRERNVQRIKWKNGRGTSNTVHEAHDTSELENGYKSKLDALAVDTDMIHFWPFLLLSADVRALHVRRTVRPSHKFIFA